MSVQIETADLHNSSHQQQLVRLLDLYSRDAMGNGAPLADATRAELVEGLRRHPASVVLLAWEGGECVGLCICFEGFSTFRARPLLNVHDLIVHPAYRNRGIGRALLRAVETAARARRCCKVTLEVRADNAAAQHLYRSVGFRDSEPPMHFWHKMLDEGR
jgi:ribosomal protein S18 acetylase RimI-like enzyme